MNTKTSRPTLVLASTSPYRQALLKRLGYPFVTAAPKVDEQPLAGESPVALVQRLAEAKARAVAAAYPQALIIGSDQVACLGDAVLGKPGSREQAIAQLTQASGKKVELITGLCLYQAASDQARVIYESFRVYFRSLSVEKIAAYVEREQPLDCAGSFKSEGLGIALFQRFEGNDPNALIGLPLIRLIDLLTEAGLDVL